MIRPGSRHNFRFAWNGSIATLRAQRLSRGVMVAQMVLVHPVGVRIPAGLPTQEALFRLLLPFKQDYAILDKKMLVVFGSIIRAPEFLINPFLFFFNIRLTKQFLKLSQGRAF